jgi:hypothetical protein
MRHRPVEVSDEFISWYDALDDDEGDRVNVAIDLLQAAGPDLGRPHVDTLKGTRIPNLKELRVQHRGRPIRILFAFDPRRMAYLILGGDKTGDKNWYITHIPIAENIYRQHLKEIGEE